jgi:hypothetical protein
MATGNMTASQTSTISEKLIKVKAYVGGDLPKKTGGDIAAFMEWNCGPAPVLVTKLLVRTPLSDFRKSQAIQNGNYLGWFEDRYSAHGQATRML